MPIQTIAFKLDPTYTDNPDYFSAVNQVFTIKNLQSFYNYRTITIGNQIELVSSVLSDEENVLFVELMSKSLNF